MDGFTEEGAFENIYWGATDSIKNYNQRRFREFLDQTPKELYEACCDKKGRLKHIIRAEHFDLPFLEKICETANAARKIARLEDNFLKGLLRSKSILNYFQQPSSRTFLSFSTAEAHLGMRREEVRELSTSSTVKGESDRDTLRTISSYFDTIVCRHKGDFFDQFAVWAMKNSDRGIPIINAGSGKAEHPTQGALDYYTIHESFDGNMEGRKIAYVGDCLRGRTVHSLAKIMALHKSSEAYFVAPEELQIDSKTKDYIVTRGTKVHTVSNPLRDLLPEMDVIYMTRMQNEHGGKGEYDRNYIFTLNMLDEMKDGAILMHPLPKREEIDPAIDDIKKDPRVMYWRQVRNGMWTRVGLLAHIFNVDGQIRNRYADLQRVA